MKKTIFTFLLTVSSFLACAQLQSKLPDTITINRGQYLTIDSLINSAIGKLTDTPLPSNQVKKIVTDINFTLQVIQYQVQIAIAAEDKKKQSLNKKP